MLIAVCILVFGGRALSSEHGRTIAYPENGESFPLDITLKNDSMIVYPGTPVPQQDCFKQSVNLHVFRRGLVAIKIVDKDVCYIKHSDETYEEVEKRLKDIKEGNEEPLTQVTEEWIVPMERVEPEKVKERFGGKIAEFCTGYDVYVLEDGHLVAPKPKRRRKTSKKTVAAADRGDCVNCYKCRVKAQLQKR